METAGEAKTLVIRRLLDSDSVSELTELLHRSYKRLADMGLRFVATHQSDAVTLERLSSGEAFVAELKGRIVGTILFRPPHLTRGCEWYDRPEVAMFGQFGVEPGLQGSGIGKALLLHCEQRAREEGASEIALDTSEKALHLIEMYQRWGYRLVGETQWDGVNYRSVIMSKRLGMERRG